MKIGISLPQMGPQATAENLIRVAQRAEALGYDSVWVSERLLWPLNPREPDLVSPDGRLPETNHIVLHPLEALTFVAAHTRRVRLGTSVLVLPYHIPVQLAKQIATLDVLSGGRMEVGVGIGWSHDEYEAVGATFERRGERSEEMLEAMIALWTQDPVAFSGSFFSIPESKFGPKPVQRPHPPLYVAGYGPYAFERAARLGQGWNPAGVQSFEWLERMIQQYHEVVGASGRDSPREVVLRMFPAILSPAAGNDRRPLTGTAEELRADVRRLRDMGVTHLIHTPAEMAWQVDPEVDRALETMEKLLEISR